METLNLTQAPSADPTLIYRYRDGLYAADLLAAALVELDLFSWINTHSATKEAICTSFEIAERPADVMLTLFTAMGIVLQRNGVFSLTQLAREYLVRNSPWFLGPYYASLKDRPVCKDFLTVLRSGKPANWGSLKNEKAWVEAMDDPGFAGQFTAAMDCRGAYLGYAVARALHLQHQSKVLDIAGGSGIYACCIVAAHPHIRATVFEKPPVDKVARRLIAERGYRDCISVLSGDMFVNPLPDDHDVHLFSNVLHDWDEPVVRRLLAGSFKALASGGILVVHDAHLNRDKTGPLHVAEYSAMLMHATEGRCYSVLEMETYLTEAGFVKVEFTPTVAARSILTAQKP